MASCVARRAYFALGRNLIARSALQKRAIHSTAVAQKKKSKVVIDDLFADDPFAEEELIKSSPSESKLSATAAEPAPTPATQQQTQDVAPTKRRLKKLDPKVRLERFESQLNYMTTHLAKPSEAKMHVRKRSLLALLDLVTTEEQVKTIVDLLPKYKAAGIQVSEHFAEAFARRCQEVHCPLLALDVFGNFSKYNVQMSQGAGRWLVHSLYVLYPLEKLMVATALFPVYNLPPISEDLPTAVMVATACYKHGSPQSIELANTLHPFINQILRKTHIAKAADLESAKMHKWVAWALYKLNKSSVKKAGRTFLSPRFIPKGFKVKVDPHVVQGEVRPTA